MALGKEYSSDYAYFIAGGKTLEIIKQYESDVANEKQLRAALAKELGGTDISGTRFEATLYADKKIPVPAGFELEREPQGKSKLWVYKADRDTKEGRAVMERLEDIPQFDLGRRIFAKRLTGTTEVQTNPDNLQQSFGDTNSHYEEKRTTWSASFSKYGDTYVVSVPRTVRGIFNEESKRASIEDHYDQAAGYTYHWFTPPDSKEIPYSRLVELQEQLKGDQLAQRTVKAKIPAFSRDR